jgi:peroxiredoxin
LIDCEFCVYENTRLHSSSSEGAFLSPVSGEVGFQAERLCGWAYLLTGSPICLCFESGWEVPNGIKEECLMRWKWFLRSFQLTGLLFILLCCPVSDCPAEGVAPGSQLPQFTLPAPDSPQAQAYLGLKTMEPFTLSKVRSKLVLIEFLNAMCTQCVANAPMVNRLYKVIQEDATLSKDVKMIGIAIGNDKTQADAFKKNTKVQFPIFPDDTFAIAATLEVAETPTMLLVSNSGKTLSLHRGAIKDFDAFLKELRAIHKTQ